MVGGSLAVVRIVVPAAALGLGFLAMRQSHVSAIGAYGLIQALPPLYYVSIALAALSFLLTWNSSRAHPLRFGLDLLVLVFLLESPPAIIEPEPRFPIAWIHVGFTDFVASTGRVLPAVDARFSWPGFFAGMGMLSRAGGLPSALLLVKWWPVAINLLYLVPFYLIARAILGDHRRAALATWLFPLTDWVGQDYYSPQSVGFLLYLFIVWLVIDQFGMRRKKLFPWPFSKQHAEPGPPSGAIPPLLGLAILTVLCLAINVSHQISPVIAGLVVIILSFFGRTRLKAFGILMPLCTAGWICYNAVTFWSGHFSALFGGLGQVGGNLDANLAGRLLGSEQHLQILYARLIVSFLVWGLAALGFAVGYRRRLEVRTSAILALTPLFVLGGGSYGGEAGLRAYMFSLAGALPLAATLLPAVPSRRSSVGSCAAVALMAALFAPGFVVARWGNELAEMVRPGEITAINKLYRIAPAGSNLVAITSEVPLRSADVSRYHYDTHNWNVFIADDVREIEAKANRDGHSGYVLITTGQLMLGEQNHGQPTDWGTRLERSLVSSGRFILVYSNPDARIYKYRPDKGRLPSASISSGP